MKTQDLAQMSVREAREKRLSNEIAEVTGLSQSAVYGRLRRAHGRTLVRNLFANVWENNKPAPAKKHAAGRVPPAPPKSSSSPLHTIARVRQRYATDCGVAVVAMLARVPYDDVKKLMFPNRVRQYYTNWNSVPKAPKKVRKPRQKPSACCFMRLPLR